MQTISITALILGWLCLAVAMVRRPRGNSSEVTHRDPASWLPFFVQAVGIGLVWNVRRQTGAPFMDGVGTLGSTSLLVTEVVLALGSGALALVAIRTLGAQWSLTAQVRSGHVLVTTGPYAYVRNPIYTALFGLLLATGISMSRWPVVVLASGVY